MLSVQTRDYTSRSSRVARHETARNTVQLSRRNPGQVMDNLPRVVFLDLDDTIIDDSSSVDGGWRTAIGDDARGIDVQSLVDAVLEVRDWYWSDAERHRVGRQDLRAASTWIVEEALRRLGMGDPELARKIANHYRDIREQGQQLLP